MSLCATAGSPPRMRGKRLLWAFNTDFIRITPAYAGKTEFVAAAYEQEADHPRVCGENVRRQPFIRVYSGSPPRMRGKHNGSNSISTIARITPAYAGKTYADSHS